MLIRKSELYNFTQAEDVLAEKKFQLSDGIKIANNMRNILKAYDKYVLEVKDLEVKYNVSMVDVDMSLSDNSDLYIEYNELGNQEVDINIDLLPQSIFNDIDVTIKELKSISYMIDPEA